MSSLREISKTGSPLSADGFEWVYREVKSDLHFNSISGGTDINGCFAIGLYQEKIKESLRELYHVISPR